MTVPTQDKVLEWCMVSIVVSLCTMVASLGIAAAVGAINAVLSLFAG